MSVEKLKNDLKKYNKSLSDYTIDNLIAAIKNGKIHGLSIDQNRELKQVYTKGEMLTALLITSKQNADSIEQAFAEGYVQGFNFGQASIKKSVDD